MSEFRTSLGEVFSLQRRLPPIGWAPKTRELAKIGDVVDASDFGLDDILGSILMIIGVVIAVAVLIPLLLFVAEVALLVALVIPLTILALVLGVKQHTVFLTRKADGKVVDTREVRGLYGTFTAGRELRAAALSGAYQSLAGTPQTAAWPAPSTAPPGYRSGGD